MELIPAIDIIDGKCVRLTNGDYSRKTIYNNDPLETALQFEGAGMTRLHLVDLDGAKAGKVMHLKVLERIASGTALQIDFGGGIKRTEDVDSIINAGAAFIGVGSIAYQDPLLFSSWLKKFGSERILLGADVMNGKIVISGWQKETGVEVGDFIAANRKAGVSTIFCTDVSKDGLLEGPSYGLYRHILELSPGLNLIASGGVSDMNDLRMLKRAGCAGVIIGKAIYENRITLKELEKFK